MRIVSLLSLLWSLVEVHCQPAPYISFMGNDVPNHGYVDLSLVGSGSNNVQCHSDLATCCTTDRGDWYFPDGARLPLSGSQGDIYVERQSSQNVNIRRQNDATSPTGIYRCEVPIDAGVRASAYVGLYTDSGGNLATFP